MRNENNYYKYYPLLRLTSRYFVAGIILRYPKPNILAPIISYMRYWDSDRIKNYCNKKNFTLEIL